MTRPYGRERERENLHLNSTKTFYLQNLLLKNLLIINMIPFYYILILNMIRKDKIKN